MTKSGPLSQTEHLLQVLNKKNKSNIYMHFFYYMYDLHVWLTTHTTKVAISINVHYKYLLEWPGSLRENPKLKAIYLILNIRYLKSAS